MDQAFRQRCKKSFDELYQSDSVGLYPPSLGCPTLYASISSGGIKLSKLRALYKKHEDQIRFYWHCPLLIAVPEEGELRAFVRGTEARERHMAEQYLRKGVYKNFHDHPLIELIVLPTP